MPPTVTVGTVIRELLPFGSNPLTFDDPPPAASWDIVPLWPPDLFAVVATLAERSGLYAEPGIALSTTPAGRRRKRERAKQAEDLGKEWGGVGLGVPPQRVSALWDILRRSWTAPVCSGAGVGRRWKEAAMHLLAIADEACAGMGFPPPIEATPSRSFAASIFVFMEYKSVAPVARSRPRHNFLPFLPNSLARAVPEDRACVLPKALTPAVGCTLRSATHNLALLPGRGEVSAEWRLTDDRFSGEPTEDGEAQHYAPFNLLLIPYPYRISGRHFRVARAPDGPDVDGYFDMEMGWLPPGTPAAQAREIARFILSLVAAAEAEGGAVNGIVLPETALPAPMAEKVAAEVARKSPHLEMFIAGVLAPPPPVAGLGEARFGRNEAYVARFRDGQRIDEYRQAKHHRWRVDGSQVESYGLGHVLDRGRNWWEKIDVADRRMVFGLDARQAVVAALICEDLARYDPVLPALAAIGPNLVIALLMDGPQLRGRWSGRHATVLADDPGSAVLTLTSMGMIQRSTPGRPATGLRGSLDRAKQGAPRA
jgi:hypothetical protein